MLYDGGILFPGAFLHGAGVLIGDDTQNNYSVPTEVIFNKQVKSIEAGYGHFLIIDEDDFLWGCGINSDGELGDGTRVTRLSPVQIGSKTWQAIAAGSTHSLAIDTDGYLFEWGRDVNLSPFQIGSKTWQAIAAGAAHSLAIDTDGLLFAWGINNNGQVGDGTTNNVWSPVQIGSKTWQAVAGGENHSLAIDSDGYLFAWGSNDSYQLGIGLISGNQLTPVQVGSNTWKAISAGEGSSMAILTSTGRLFGFGQKSTGRLGGGSTTGYFASPTLVLDIACSYVGCGENHTVAIADSGEIYVTGFNNYGKLGLGDEVTRTSFTLQGTWTIIAAGSGLTLFYL